MITPPMGAGVDGWGNDYSLPGVSPRAIVRRPYRAPHPNVPGSIINNPSSPPAAS